MQIPESYVNERLDHLGVVAGVCEEIGLDAYLDRLAGKTNRQMSVGTGEIDLRDNQETALALASDMGQTEDGITSHRF